MPNVIAPTRNMGNGDVITQFVDSVGTSAITYTYAKIQEKIIIKNISEQPFSITVAAVTRVVVSGQKWENVGDFTTFTINGVGGFSAFDVYTDEKGSVFESPEGVYYGPGGLGSGGAAGPLGPSGTQGLQGLKGDKGDTGTQGPQGIQGLTGPQGQQGPAGQIGATGAQGPQGLQGVKGDVGSLTGLITELHFTDAATGLPYKLVVKNAAIELKAE